MLWPPFPLLKHTGPSSSLSMDLPPVYIGNITYRARPMPWQQKQFNLRLEALPWKDLSQEEKKNVNRPIFKTRVQKSECKTFIGMILFIILPFLLNITFGNNCFCLCRSFLSSCPPRNNSSFFLCYGLFYFFKLSHVFQILYFFLTFCIVSF